MYDRSGHRRTELLRTNPSVDAARNCDRIYKGVVNAVYFRNILFNGVQAQQTFVDLQLLGIALPELRKVPIAGRKSNLFNGEDWAPEPRDMVLVQFIDGKINQPIVTGYLYPSDMNMVGITPDSDMVPVGKSRYNKRCNNTSETIDKDGNRIISVAGDDTLTVTGDGSVTIGGNMSVNVTGTATITVTGNATISSDGNVTVEAVGTASVTGAVVEVESSGNVSITGTGTVTATSTGAMSLTSSAGACSIGGTAMNVTSSGVISIASSGQVNISGTNVAISA